MSGWVSSLEPKRKMCGWRPNCGRCANCANRAWGRVWDQLDDQWKDWVRGQLAMTVFWGGGLPPERGTFAWEMFGEPSSCQYVLK